MDGYRYFGIALIALALLGIGFCEPGDGGLAVIMLGIGIWLAQG